MIVKPDKQPESNYLVKLTTLLVALVVIMVVLVVLMAGSLIFAPQLTAWFSKEEIQPARIEKISTLANEWRAPADAAIPEGEAGEEIRYGRELIAHTSEYLGPKGKVMPISNGMNCQNCHLDAGTRPFGNNFGAVASTYPKFRARSGTEETIEKRVNDCFERSLNGKPLAEDSREMKAIVAYIRWLGKDVPKGIAPEGSGLLNLAFLDRAADPQKGQLIYEQKCVTCHGTNGNGISNADGTTYTYPPLWGEHSYNTGAGLYRLSRIAGYIKANMPWGATYNAPQLTDEEAWDVAAYINSMYHPIKDFAHDWPDISKKPVDHPFGPFTDNFSEEQHKYGPYKPIVEKQKNSNKTLAEKK